MWFRGTVLRTPMVFLPIRSDDAFLIASIGVLPWMPAEWECNTVLAVADHGKMWQLVTLLRFSIDWAKKRRCSEWRMSSETTHDLGAIAKRLGCDELTPRWRMRL
jgi:hypothetical protein